MSTLLLLGTKTWQAFNRDNCTQMAAAISYYVLFAVVPLAIFAVSIVGMVVSEEAQERLTEEVTEYVNAGVQNVVIELDARAREGLVAEYGRETVDEIEASLEALDSGERLELARTLEDGGEVDIAGVPLDANDLEVHTDNIIADVISDVVAASPALSIFSLVTTTLAATIMFSAVRRSLNVVWSAVHRPFVQQRLIELAMMFGALAFLLISLASTAAMQFLREASGGPSNPIDLPDGPLWAALGFLVPWVLSFALFLALFLIVPNAKASAGDVWPGALLSATLFELLKYGYSVYVVNFTNYGAVYGALGGVLLFMLFTYFASYFLLMGAELAVQNGRWRAGELREEATASQDERTLWEKAVSTARGMFVARKD